jgi:SPP1 gp7 family putative phage head morphogenesis protein
MADFLDWFKLSYSKEAQKLVTLVYSSSITKVHDLVDTEISSFEPIFNDMFKNGKTYSEDIVKKELLDLVDTVKVPFKYNKNVIDKINGKSVFTGYYDEQYKDVFTKKELYKLKSTILAGKYAGVSEQELANQIKTVVNISDQRARLLARTEMQRLQETTTAIYYEQPEVMKMYDRVWITKDDDRVRTSHQSMDGEIAETSGPHSGQFYSKDVGWISGPGSGPPSFSIGCRCHTKFVKKEGK